MRWASEHFNGTDARVTVDWWRLAGVVNLWGLWCNRLIPVNQENKTSRCFRSLLNWWRKNFHLCFELSWQLCQVYAVYGRGQEVLAMTEVTIISWKEYFEDLLHAIDTLTNEDVIKWILNVQNQSHRGWKSRAKRHPLRDPQSFGCWAESPFFVNIWTEPLQLQGIPPCEDLCQDAGAGAFFCFLG